ncbi:hypothetical protein BB560_003702, partial [Smittium megazygosporum]
DPDFTKISLEFEDEMEEDRRFVKQNAKYCYLDRRTFLTEYSDIFFLDAAAGRAALYRNGFTLHTLFDNCSMSNKFDLGVVDKLLREITGIGVQFGDSIGNGSTIVNNEVDFPGLNQIYSMEDVDGNNSFSDSSILCGTNAEADLINKVVLNMLSW